MQAGRDGGREDGDVPYTIRMIDTYCTALYCTILYCVWRWKIGLDRDLELNLESFRFRSRSEHM